MLYIFNSCLLIINHVSKEKILCKIEQMINKNVFKKTSKKQIMIHTKNANIMILLCICDILINFSVNPSLYHMHQGLVIWYSPWYHKSLTIKRWLQYYILTRFFSGWGAGARRCFAPHIYFGRGFDLNLLVKYFDLSTSWLVARVLGINAILLLGGSRWSLKQRKF